MTILTNHAKSQNRKETGLNISCIDRLKKTIKKYKIQYEII